MNFMGMILLMVLLAYLWCVCSAKSACNVLVVLRYAYFDLQPCSSHHASLVCIPLQIQNTTSFSNPLSPKNVKILPSSFGNPHIAFSSSNIILTINLKHIQTPFVQLLKHKRCFKWKLYESHITFQDIWLVKFPSVKSMAGSDGIVNQVCCKVCTFYEGKEKILATKLDSLFKHVRQKKPKVNIPKMVECTIYYCRCMCIKKIMSCMLPIFIRM